MEKKEISMYDNFDNTELRIILSITTIFFFFSFFKSRISTAYNETHVAFGHRINDTVIRYIGRDAQGHAIRAGNDENKFSLGIIGGS